MYTLDESYGVCISSGGQSLASGARSFDWSFEEARVRHVEQEQPSMSLDSILIASPEGTVAVLRSLPPDIHQDLECGVCREIMGRDSAQITNVPIPV